MSKNFLLEGGQLPSKVEESSTAAVIRSNVSSEEKEDWGFQYECDCRNPGEFP